MADYLPSWRFNSEDPEASGKVLDRREVPNRYKEGQTVTILTVDTPYGAHDVWCDKAALKAFVRDAAPVVGDYVTIVFEGSEPIVDKDGTPWITPDGNQGSRKLFRCEKVDGPPAAAALPPSAAPSAPVGDDDIPF